LVQRIAADNGVSGEEILAGVSPRASLPYKTELLFQHFRATRLAGQSTAEGDLRKSEYQILAEWLVVLASHLYADAPGDFREKLSDHPYLNAFLPLIKQSEMTVTYNFDTFVEEALTATRSPEDAAQSRGYEIVTNPWTQFRRKRAVIYHPNGVVPRVLMEAPVDRVVFSEASYADQLIGAMAGDYSALLNHLARKTCLFIGLSLDDEMLRSVLIQSARANPGNYHYYVFYTGDGGAASAAHLEAIRQANFSVYNLITLALDDVGLASLGELLNVQKFSENVVADFAEENGINLQFRYYFTGPLGVGKSTSVSSLRNLLVFDEWVEPRLEVLGKPWAELSEEEREQADGWILHQFRLKNDNLRHGRMGIFVIDRPPLDPLSFTPEDEWREKAELLLSKICPGKAAWRVQRGQVLLLTGDPQELSARMGLTKRDGYTPDRLRAMEKTLKRLYDLEGVTAVDTRGLSILELVNKVSEIIHMQEYVEADLHSRLQEIVEGDLSPSPAS